MGITSLDGVAEALNRRNAVNRRHSLQGEPGRDDLCSLEPDFNLPEEGRRALRQGRAARRNAMAVHPVDSVLQLAHVGGGCRV